MEITRRNVIKTVTASVAASTAMEVLARQQGSGASAAQDFYTRLVRANDRTVATMLKNEGAPRNRPRGIGRGANVGALVAAYVAPESTYHKQENLIPLMESAAAVFTAAQHPDGTIDAGNLSSPPDTGFVVEGLATIRAVLRQENDPKLKQVEQTLDKFLLAAGEALTTGGVHTPNHRWVISAALARLNSLYPSAKYVARIDDWLGEGIYIDADGQFAERSTGIYSRVVDNAFLTMARLLNRPNLLEPVRKNLNMNLYYIHPDGEVETVGSRRQDQAMVVAISNYYLQYRYLAIHDSNLQYAAVARLIELRPGEGVVEGNNPLINFMEEPLLKKPLPEGGSIPDNYAKVFTNTRLARVRRGDISATIYGGSDWPLGVASGLASNPTFFNFRKGKAILQSVRMAGEFFGEGVFRSETFEVNGSEYALHQRFDVPYYQPLPKQFRNSHGDYALTPARDARFWSKLDFPHRRMGNIQTLDQKVVVIEKGGVFELHFDIGGHNNVPFTVEFAFRPGGEFSGSLQKISWHGADVFLLKEGSLQYRVGNDAIEIGPGQAEHQQLNLSGPSYAAHGATLETPGIRVYITGFTPFRNVVTVKSVA
ncbi:MAG TPA: hypothetical protein VFA65_18570 [Bryobacteraceae bacterium]|nr:hypothetical protein [Bryobacteraceae bacterium]